MDNRKGVRLASSIAYLFALKLLKLNMIHVTISKALLLFLLSFILPLASLTAMGSIISHHCLLYLALIYTISNAFTFIKPPLSLVNYSRSAALLAKNNKDDGKDFIESPYFFASVSERNSTNVGGAIGTAAAVGGAVIISEGAAGGGGIAATVSTAATSTTTTATTTAALSTGRVAATTGGSIAAGELYILYIRVHLPTECVMLNIMC